MRPISTPLDEHAGETSLCAGCPKMCRHVCPVSNAEARDTVTPGHKMAVLDLARRGHVPVDAGAGSLWDACTGCAACSQFCLFGNDVAGALVTARQAVVAAGFSDVALRMRERLQHSGNPTGSNLAALQREQLPVRADAGYVAFFPGCTALRRLPEHASDALAALERTVDRKVSIVPVKEDAACCGYPLWAAGLKEEFLANARRVAAHLDGRGVVLTADPGCAYTLKVLYRAYGITPQLEVHHVSEWLAGATESVAVPVRGQRSLYHDPCHLGRKLGVLEPPRVALARAEGVEPLEFVWNREHSECCGAGALYPLANRAGSLKAAQRRMRNEVDEMARTGATRVVTACPSCELNLSRTGVPVFDLCRAVLGRDQEAPRRAGP